MPLSIFRLQSEFRIKGGDEETGAVIGCDIEEEPSFQSFRQWELL